MLISEFTTKYSFKQRDKEIAEKVYSGKDETEEQWILKLKNEFDFDHANFKGTEINPIPEEVTEIVDEETINVEKEEEAAETSKKVSSKK